jgi:glycosyltransferase involved in cell wall biosynthesis
MADLRVMSILNLRPRKLGSFEEYTLALSRTLTEQGSTSVLVFKDAPPDSLRPYYTEAGAVLDQKPFEPFGRDSARGVRTLLRRHRPHVIHLHFVNLLSLDVVAAGLNSGAKVVFSEHSSDIAKQRSPARWQMLRASKRVFSSCVSQFIAPSDYVNARLVREGVNARHVMTIHNGVNVERFAGPADSDQVRANYGIERDAVLVVSISQLIPEKGVADLIDAAARVIGQGRNVSFIHIGDGRCGAEYREKVRHFGIEKRFVFAGLLNLPEIGLILRQSDVFVLPCTWGEAFSLVILEAMAAGKPAIVTSVGGNIEAVEHGRNGLVVPPHDPEKLADAIISLHDSPERRLAMGQESTRRSAYFSVQRWVDQTIDVYRRLA